MRPSAEADLDEGVEDVAVATGGADPGVDDARRLREPGGHPGVAQVRAEERTHHVPVACPGGLGAAERDGAGSGAAGGDPGGDGVVDALAGHRVHQPGGVADEEHGPVGLVPAPAAQRQVVAAPVAAGAGRPGHELLELVEQQAAAGRAGAGPLAGQQLAVADVGEAVAAVEGPGVRRLRAVAEADDLAAAHSVGDVGA